MKMITVTYSNLENIHNFCSPFGICTTIFVFLLARCQGTEIGTCCKSPIELWLMVKIFQLYS